MKRTLAILIAATTLVATMAPAAWAQTDTTEIDRLEQRANDLGNSLERVKEAAAAAIEQRFDTLDRLTEHVESYEHLTDSHAASLLADYESTRAGLTALGADIEATDNLADALELSLKIAVDYRVYLVVTPKSVEVAVSDTIVAAVEPDRRGRGRDPGRHRHDGGSRLRRDRGSAVPRQRPGQRRPGRGSGRAGRRPGHRPHRFRLAESRPRPLSWPAKPTSNRDERECEPPWRESTTPSEPSGSPAADPPGQRTARERSVDRVVPVHTSACDPFGQTRRASVDVVVGQAGDPRRSHRNCSTLSPGKRLLFTYQGVRSVESHRATSVGTAERLCERAAGYANLDQERGGTRWPQQTGEG